MQRDKVRTMLGRRRRRLRGLSSLCAAAVVLSFGASVPAENQAPEGARFASVRDAWEVAGAAKSKSSEERAAAVAYLSGLATNATVEADLRLEATLKLLSFYESSRQYSEAFAVGGRSLALSSEPETRVNLHYKLAFVCRSAQRYDDAVRHVRQLLAECRAADPALYEQWIVRALRVPIAPDVAAKAVMDEAVEFLDKNPAAASSVRADVLYCLAEACLELGLHEDAEARSREALALDGVSWMTRGRLYKSLVASLATQKKYDAIMPVLLEGLERSSGAVAEMLEEAVQDSVLWKLEAGDEDWGALVLALQQGAAQRAAAGDWAGVGARQTALVQILSRLGRKEEALQEAKVHFYGCPRDAAQDAMELVCAALKSADRNLGRANAFLRFQKFGPEGEDGLAGTEDDLFDPLLDVPPVENAARDRLYADALKRLPVDWTGLMRRSRLHVYGDEPVEALAALVRALEICPTNEEAMQKATDALTALIIRLTKDAAAAQQVAKYTLFGPLGEDGRPRTDDDLTDPVPALMARLRDRLSSDGGSEETAAAE